MAYATQNPVNGAILKSFPTWDRAKLTSVLERVGSAQRNWSITSFEQRADLLSRVGMQLRRKRDEYAALITLEMGKLAREARAEVEKSALNCDYYAVHGEPFLSEELIRTDAGRSFVTYLPLGTVLGIMPWNFPFWQVFRFAAPALMAGNACLLKHASNVPQCAQAIEAIFHDAGLPEHLFTALFVDADDIAEVIASDHVQAVTLTGSEGAGRKIGALAGQHLKKCVLELGGSDPFIVLHDANVERAVEQAVASRYLNCGQSCIAAKRFIVVPEIADRFVQLLCERAKELKFGDPNSDGVHLGPMAKREIRDELQDQVTDAIQQGATALLGCEPFPGAGSYYPASILDRVTPAMRVYHEEVFGPVATVIRAADEADAIRIANDSAYGLASSIWSEDHERAERLSHQIEAGASYVNGMVRSDPRLPFGGIKASGFGRELSYHGIREFTNAKTVWVRESDSSIERRQLLERRQNERRGVENLITLEK
ncbi:MAG: NAD-dependent succinate-semialdehyde dehydrogenase [Burkholderiales bacterium]